MSYRIGYIGWKIAARMGLPLTAVIDIHRDEEDNPTPSTSAIFGVCFEPSISSRSICERVLNADQKCLSFP